MAFGFFISVKFIHNEGGRGYKQHSGFSLEQDYKTGNQRDSLWVTYKTGNHWEGCKMENLVKNQI